MLSALRYIRATVDIIHALHFLLFFLSRIADANVQFVKVSIINMLNYIFCIVLFWFCAIGCRWRSGNSACWWFSTVKTSRTKWLTLRSRARRRIRNLCRRIRLTKAPRLATQTRGMHFRHKFSPTSNIVVIDFSILSFVKYNSEIKY